MIKILNLTKETWGPYSSKLQALEANAEYPLGADFFQISHGASYFGFFERLGDPVFHIALDGEEVIACAAGILRELPFGKKAVRAWYLCDLKVHPQYRRQGIPTRLFLKRVFWNFLKCSNAYAISMDPADQPNPMVALTAKLPWFPLRVAGKLKIYSLAFEEYLSVKPELEHLLGPISFLSLEGKKDIVLKSTGMPMKILHLQHGPMGDSAGADAARGAAHMLCATDGSLLDKILSTRFREIARASVLAHGLNKMDWGLILTSDV